MDILTLDFETYYDKDFSLSKITTEEYIRSPLFEVIGVSVKLNGEEAEWASGTHAELHRWLRRFDWANSMALAHNAMFDGAILNWIFGLTPKVWLDTLCMGRALHGVEVSGSLAALSVREGVGEKGTEVADALGMRLKDFRPGQLARYGDYCINDVELTYKLFNKMLPRFPKVELKLIDVTTRMFTEPVLELDSQMLKEHLQEVQAKKEALLADSSVTTDDLMSNPKFAEALMELGVTPPTKTSLRTGKEAYAFAKNDEAFLNLLEHPDWRVQGLVTARLGLKSTLEETRTERFIGIAERGSLPVPIKYYAAHTGRFGGSDKINLQNLPSRGVNGGKLKRAIKAPEGYSVIDADSSQIEARVLAWLSGQDDLVDAFARKQDVYKKMASAIYGKAEEDIVKEERFVGKTTILGCGYGMGAVKFQSALKSATPSTVISIDEARRIIDIYRKTNHKVTALWKQAQLALVALSRKEDAELGRSGVLKVEGANTSIRLPNGLPLRYDDLTLQEGDKGFEFTYKTRKGRTRIYGGKVVENVCQAIARCIIGEQMLRIAKCYKVVLTVHDAVACIVPDDEVEQARAYVEGCMRWVPDWAKGMPLDCESGYGKSYGDC
jgi:DNA polymerase I-like protein with 3'-5' exonuclease and polymerase domains